MKFVQRFRTVITYAINSGFITTAPCAHYKMNFERTDRDYLVQQEIDIIFNKEFALKRLAQVRDMFIFSCYTGLSYVDVCKLTSDNIRLGFDGNLWIMTKREKTGVNSNIRLLDVAKLFFKNMKENYLTD